jgi:cytochrome o ubiquinol oxidase subunit II
MAIKKRLKTRHKLVVASLLLIAFISLLIFLATRGNVPILSPKGPVAEKQYDLLIFASALSVLVIVPVYIMTFFIVWKYREGNHKAKYTPNWDGNRLVETIWWGIPLLIIAILSVVIIKSSHDLDPFKPVAADKRPVTVQVVALDWKWLFIYPEYGVASVNEVHLPEDTPINFEITSDGPMNSFWLPQLGGQIYAMAGMKTKLHLLADEPGEYQGSSANLSGEGFSGMNFKALVSTESDFTHWLAQNRSLKKRLDKNEYLKLAEPSQNHPITHYGSIDLELYNEIIMKYMATNNHEGAMEGHAH